MQAYLFNGYSAWKTGTKVRTSNKLNTDSEDFEEWEIIKKIPET